MLRIARSPWRPEPLSALTIRVAPTSSKTTIAPNEPFFAWLQRWGPGTTQYRVKNGRIVNDAGFKASNSTPIALQNGKLYVEGKFEPRVNKPNGEVAQMSLWESQVFFKITDQRTVDAQFASQGRMLDIAHTPNEAKLALGTTVSVMPFRFNSVSGVGVEVHELTKVRPRFVDPTDEAMILIRNRTPLEMAHDYEDDRWMVCGKEVTDVSQLMNHIVYADKVNPLINGDLKVNLRIPLHSNMWVMGNRGDTVRQIKYKISSRIGVPAESLRLFVGRSRREITNDNQRWGNVDTVFVRVPVGMHAVERHMGTLLPKGEAAFLCEVMEDQPRETMKAKLVMAKVAATRKANQAPSNLRRQPSSDTTIDRKRTTITSRTTSNTTSTSRVIGDPETPTRQAPRRLKSIISRKHLTTPCSVEV